ncbi:MAG TPA: cytochrome b562 [Rariglobus sp.]|nr:cytochrome b562 [Rariglobus sp.]
MKLRLLLAALSLSLAASPFVRAAGEDETQLGKEMSAMNKAFRQLKKQAADATQNAASAELVAQVKKNAEASIELIPEKAAGLPEAERAAFAENYKKEMKAFVGVLGKLEAAFKAGDNEAAGKLIAEIGALQKAGHKEFRKPKE